jgi:hypothetical protein
MITTTVKAVGHDNRGDDEIAYGFVYFDDERRVAYATGQGVVQDATGGWDEVTDQHVKVAEEYLKGKGVPLAC